jgi:hypothetical protein
VKIRGFRIELGEIESALRDHASIGQCVVVAREDEPGDKRLVAYVIPAPGAEIDAAELRSHLGRSLPEYMVPAAFMELAELPLSPNGKLDRKSLPAPNDESYGKRNYEVPIRYTEIALAQIWTDLLNIKQVGRHDNFFELGGHSLLAVRLKTRIHNQLGYEITLKNIFENPKLVELARFINFEAGKNSQEKALEEVRTMVMGLSDEAVRLLLDRKNAQ